MTGEWIDVAVSGGTMAAYRVGTGAAGLVMLQEIFGVNAAMQEKARRFAAHGYTVLVPDVFWRLEPRVALGYSGADREKAFAFFGRFDLAAGVQDIAAAARHLERSHPKLGVIGFCLGGRLAVASTAAYPFRCVASLYGVKLEADPERLRAIDVPLQVHVGDRDSHVPQESIQAIRAALQGRANAEVFVYEGAQHGFFNAARPEVHAPQAARQAEERILALFRRALT
ncbi:MAG TPA: dienelactone hydrolase family protein [Burkholderiales bacterium]|nr:dienelactone hydrolase family protein [Burkholderiales bacterium]